MDPRRELAPQIAKLWTPQGVHELRIPKAGRARTIAGYFDNPDDFAQEAARLDREKHPGIYLTINPVNPDLLARSANKAVPYAETTTADKDIAHRRWLVVDLDPIRPTGIPSTATEHLTARTRALYIDAELSAEGWPDPVYMDSGNGAYLLYRVDLPNDPESADLLHRVLAELGRRYDDQMVKVDQTMYNAARIVRVPGTHNRKGSGTSDRPHRLAQLWDPDAPIPEPIDLRLLAAWTPAPTPTPTSRPSPTRPGTPGEGYDIERMLALVGRTRGPKLKDGSEIWELEICPFNSDHNRWEAVIVRRSGGGLAFKCPHDGCANSDWADLRAALDPKPERPREPARRPTPAQARPRPLQADDEPPEPVDDAIETPDPAEQLDLFGGTTPAEFWGERPGLLHIHQAARASLTSPWAVLGRVLLRIVAATPPWLVLPALVGREASINLYVVAVDPSGGGKSSASDVGDHTLNGVNGYIERPVGSGEGLVSLYMRATRHNGVWSQEQHNTAAILTADEIGSLFAQDQRTGSTLGAFLRTGWTGRQLGAAYRDQEKNLVAGTHRYRLCLWAGAQPGLCGPLMAPTSIAAGTPQRMVYLPAIDPHAPDETPEWPTPLIWQPPRWGDDPLPGVVRTIPVCAAAQAEIRRARQAQLRNRDQRNPLDGHALLNREKVAAALGLLDGRVGISDDDWRLAGVVMQMSDATRASIQRALAQEVEKTARGKAYARAQEAIEIAERLDDRQTKKASQAILRRLAAQPDEDPWVPRAVLRSGVGAPHRPVFEEVLARLIDVGMVEVEEVVASGQKGTRYRRVKGTDEKY